MRPVITVAATELRRFLRDRSNIFFVFIFPLLLVLVLGSQFGGSGSSGRVSIAGESGPLEQAISAQLTDAGITVDTGGHDEVLDRVSRGRTDVGLFIPAGANAAYGSDEPVRLEVVPGSQSNAIAVQQQVRGAVGALDLDRARVRALVAEGGDRGVDASTARTALAAVDAQVTPPSLRIEDVDEIAQEFSGLGRFDLGASSQLLLFVFLISLAGSTTLIQARRLGIIARALSTPVSTGQVLLGEAAGRWAIAVFQGAYIMIATALLFGVRWGDPFLSGLVLLVFGAVSAGAAMLLGALMDNEAAASGVGIGIGLVLAGLGGGMVPLEIFTDTLRTVAHVTPHAWAYDAFAAIQRHHASLVDILPELGVLAAMALVLLALGTWALRRSVARAM
ncbi:MAG: ABC transporter permease [Micrococcales bacterium]|nr:ABC transporter permease [Micrococcales bacterium]